MRTSPKTPGLTDSGRGTSAYSLLLPPLEFGRSAEVTTDYILAMLNDDPELLALAGMESDTGALNLPLQGEQAAAGNYNGLFGTASQQTLTSFGTVPGTAGTRAGKDVTLYGKVRRALRELVDEWLDSGFVGKSEVPTDRNFEKSPKCQKALYSFSRSGGLLLLPYGKAPSLYFNDQNLRLTFRGNAFEEIVRPEIAFILLSGLRVRLAKCRKCSIYFLLKRWRKPYSRGTKCDSCSQVNRRDDSVASTASARTAAYALLYQSAAKKFHKKLRGVAGWHDDKSLKVAIAAYLSPYILRSNTLRPLHPNGITGKWTAQKKNWQGIDMALKTLAKVASSENRARKAKG